MTKKIKFYLLLLFLTSSLCYLLLVAGNIILKRTYNNNITSNYSEALEIEKNRHINTDVAEIDKAVKEGYSPVLQPVFFDFPKRIKILQDLVFKYKYIPLGAQPNRDVYYCNEGYGLIKYKSDRYGFRNPDELWDKEERPDILLIGDSFVHGACVEENFTFRGQIAKTFPLTFNLGMSGSQPKLYSRTAEFFIKKIRPKNVVIFFFANDNEGEYMTIFEKNFIKNSNNLLYEDSLLLKEFYDEAEKLSDLYAEAEPPKKRLWERLKDDFQLEFFRQILFKIPQKSTNEAIDTVITMCEEYSCNPYFVFLPTSMFWRPDSRQEDYKSKIKLYLENKHSLSKNFYDATSLINKNGKEMFATMGPHYSPKGYQLISSEIINLIKNSKP
tara:strand:- start:172 stop:1326 length:1155 start_codon:yes stop_codon:yes gene_type:complete